MTSAVDACASAIRSGILRGELEAGSRLPAERKLAETFGVNRVTVRSALTQLAALGLLRVRHGSGYHVQDFRRVGGLELLPDLIAFAKPSEQADLVNDLLEIRRELAEVAFRRLGALPKADIDAIAHAVEAFAGVTSADLDTIAQADVEVVATLLEATQSRVLQLCLNPIISVVSRVPELRRALYAKPQTNLFAYRGLVAWLRLSPPDRPDASSLFPILESHDAQTVAHLRNTPRTS
ncbi:MAG: GntR family transcriptional regulator [Myxococcota bacterium]